MTETVVRKLVWRQAHWPQPLNIAQAIAALRMWAADQQSPRLVLEVRATNVGTAYLLGGPLSVLLLAQRRLRTAVPDVRLTEPDQERSPVVAAGRLKLSTWHRALRTDQPETTAAAVLGALTTVRTDELLVLQIVLGPRRIPLAVPTHSPSSIVAPWWQVIWRGDGGQVDSEKRTALRDKVSDHGYAATVRLGVSASTATRRRTLIASLHAALRTSEAPGVQLRLRRQKPKSLNDAQVPWRWPLRINASELLLLTGWPVGDRTLPGQPPEHPKLLPPPAGTTGQHRIVAESTAPGVTATLALSPANALHHLHVLGPTGTGKSALLGNLISQDIAAGRAVVVIEPKGDLVADVLTRIPANRRDDIVVLDPNDAAPVGFNPLRGRGRRPELIADAQLATFKQLYGKAIGPRSSDILYAVLLTLARHKDASLVMAPLLLTNPGFRRSLTANLHDPLTLDPFWGSYEAWSDGERATAIGPIQNKLRPILRAGLRGVLGQRRPKFDIRQVFTERKVLLVPLQRGIVGPEAAGLLGSIITTELWQAAQERAAIPAERRHPVMVYIDEVQNYLNIGADLGEALAQSRGYGVSFTLAHQHRGQTGADMRAALLTNTRSRVVFQLPPDDAAVMARAHPEIDVADLTALGQYEIYASLFAHGQVTPYASGRTLRPAPATTDPDDIRRRSREHYGHPLDAIEADFAALVNAANVPLGDTGRRRRRQP